ncbi:MAG TPA: hypothetical protein VKE51_38840 [Vicinamibacterales bacterium]|nr:hypothetical protein [Vicinamibacterales bacterium]
MKPGVWRHPELVFAAIMCTIVALSGPRLAQPLGYHRFADTRAFFGVPNALDVLSNAPFAIVGIASLFVVFRVHTFVNPVERWSYVVLFAGVTLTAFGSAYYHLAPDNDRLVWDRLPMAVGFMGLLAAIVAERVSAPAARILLVPLLALGCGSVLYWHWTELHGAGDLRLYLLVQFGSLIVIVLLLCLYRPRYSGTAYLVAGLAAYAAAKGLELADRAIFETGHLVSGHTLKHLAAAAGVACVARMLAVRARYER